MGQAVGCHCTGESEAAKLDRQLSFSGTDEDPGPKQATAPALEVENPSSTTSKGALCVETPPLASGPEDMGDVVKPSSPELQDAAEIQEAKPDETTEEKSEVSQSEECNASEGLRNNEGCNDVKSSLQRQTSALQEDCNATECVRNEDNCKAKKDPFHRQASACHEDTGPKKAKKSAEAEKKRQAAEARARASQKKRDDLMQRAEEMRDNNPGEHLCRLARDGKVKTLQRLLDVKASPTSTDSKGCFALLEACRTGSTEVAKLLVEAKTDPNKSGVLTDGQTSALHVAAKFNHVDILKLLLDKGASSTVKNWRSQVPLEVAQQFKALDAQQILEKHGRN